MVTAAQKKAADDKADQDKADKDAADTKAATTKKAAEAKADASNDSRNEEIADAHKPDGDGNTVAKTLSSADTVQVDEDDDTSIAQPEAPLQPRTVEGKDGIERLIEGPSDGWEPAQVEPTPGEIKAAAEREKAEQERKERRLSEHPADRDNGNEDAKDES